MANWLDLVFGQKPEVAPYVPTDLSAEQLKAITENISAFPEIQQLGGLYEQYMLDSFNEAIPGFSNILASGGKVTQEMLDQAGTMLQGKIPPDVQEAIFRGAAQSGLSSGTLFGPMGASIAPRDLGLTSLNLIGQGAQLAGEAGNAAQRWAGLASGLIMSPSGMMVTPQEQAQLTMQNNLMRQATKQLQYNIAAAPDPAAAGISGTLMNLLGAYLGKGMGGGKGSITPSYGSVMGNSTSANWMGNIGQGAGFNFGGVPTAASESPSVFNDTVALPSSVDYASYAAPAYYGTAGSIGGLSGIDLGALLGYQSNFQTGG